MATVAEACVQNRSNRPAMKTLNMSHKLEVGRPTLRWLKDGGCDLQGMKLKRWMKNANNREEWESLTKDAKVLK
jgi:hypothetical protein